MKAVGLLSGGLDSTLAARMMLEQGIEVHAINFTSPFCRCTPHSAGCAAVVVAVQQLGNIPLKRVGLGDEYLSMIRKPKHGYGRGMNPCVDCRILKLRKAGEYMKEIGASFLFTGEVLGQRPMSQHLRALKVIDDDSGLKGLILRPLSAALLEPTLPETEGWVDRAKLLDIAGRGRTRQIHLAEDKGIRDYPCPAGGCLLTDVNFAVRLREHFAAGGEATAHAMVLLQVGRHFRLPDGGKAIVARDEKEGARLQSLVRPAEHLLVPDFPGPTVLLQGADVDAALALLMRYVKKAVGKDAVVRHSHQGAERTLPVPVAPVAEAGAQELGGVHEAQA